MGRGAEWTESEDGILRKCVEEAKLKNLSDSRGVQKAMEQITRSKSSCLTRWYTVLSKRDEQTEVKKIPSKNDEMSAKSILAYVHGLEQKVKSLSEELENCHEQIKDFESVMRVLKQAQMQIETTETQKTLKSSNIFKMNQNGNLERMG